MILKCKNILLVSPEPWSHIFVSKHHYAVHLAKRENKVYFLNPPSLINKISPTDFDNVWQINYTGFPKGLRFLPPPLQKFFIKKVFQQLQSLCKVQFDIIWSFDNSVFFDFSALPERTLKISHIVDLNQNFQLASAAKTADYCFCTTNLIKDRLENYSIRVFKINHGFNNIPIEDHKLSPIPGPNGIKAILVGNLAMPYIDWKILHYTAKENKNVDFVFYGPGAEKFTPEIDNDSSYKEKLFKFSNTYFPGRIPSNEILSILNKSDILMISYKEEHYDDQANPHKMMEYLASGKMIVATFTSEYELLEKEYLIAMSKKNDDFLQIFNYTLANLAMWNAEEKQLARKAFALENTYGKQINRIEELINPK